MSGFVVDMTTPLEKRIYKKEIIGSVAQIRSKREAEKGVVALRSSINVDIGTPKSYAILRHTRWQVDWVAQLPSLAGDESEVSRR